MVCASVVSDLPISFLKLVTLSLQIMGREKYHWFILLQMYGSLNTKMPNEAAECHSVTETLYIRTAGLE
jgi:hypothetical protein